MYNPEGLNLNEMSKSPESLPLFVFTYFDRTKEGNKEIPFTYKTFTLESDDPDDPGSAYKAYVEWCLTNKIEPLGRGDVSINRTQEKSVE